MSLNPSPFYFSHSALCCAVTSPLKPGLASFLAALDWKGVVLT